MVYSMGRGRERPGGGGAVRAAAQPARAENRYSGRGDVSDAFSQHDQGGERGTPAPLPIDEGASGEPVGIRYDVSGNGHAGTSNEAPASSPRISSVYDPFDPFVATPPEQGTGEVAPEADAPDTTGDVPTAERKHSARRLVIELVETIVMAALIFLAVRAVVQNFKVEGSSMYPTFYDGEFLLVNKIVYTRIDLGTVHKFLPFISAGKNPEHYIFHGPQRGDVIVFHPPASQGGDTKDYIKRVIGLPGETVDVRDNHVYINGRELEEPYISAPTMCGGQYCHMTLGPNQYYVLGDNRTASSDSRFWGPVSADKIIGKALFVYWCGGTQCKNHFDRFGPAPNHHPQLAPAP